jgi:predicted ester cyclase
MGKQVTVTGMLIARVANGKIIEEWGNTDWMGLLQQLGVVPIPGQAS